MSFIFLVGEITIFLYIKKVFPDEPVLKNDDFWLYSNWYLGILIGIGSMSNSPAIDRLLSMKRHYDTAITPTPAQVQFPALPGDPPPGSMSNFPAIDRPSFEFPALPGDPPPGSMSNSRPSTGPASSFRPFPAIRRPDR
jgi:hypothetical protein